VLLEGLRSAAEGIDDAKYKAQILQSLAQTASKLDRLGFVSGYLGEIFVTAQAISETKEEESVYLTLVEEACRLQALRQARGFALEIGLDDTRIKALSHFLLARAEADRGDVDEAPESAQTSPRSGA